MHGNYVSPYDGMSSRHTTPHTITGDWDHGPFYKFPDLQKWKNLVRDRSTSMGTTLSYSLTISSYADCVRILHTRAYGKDSNNEIWTAWGLSTLFIKPFACPHSSNVLNVRNLTTRNWGVIKYISGLAYHNKYVPLFLPSKVPLVTTPYVYEQHSPAKCSFCDTTFRSLHTISNLVKCLVLRPLECKGFYKNPNSSFTHIWWNLSTRESDWTHPIIHPYCLLSPRPPWSAHHWPRLSTI